MHWLTVFIFLVPTVFASSVCTNVVDTHPSTTVWRRGTVYDVFTFMDETNLLALRVHELRAVVDVFVPIGRRPGPRASWQRPGAS